MSRPTSYLHISLLLFFLFISINRLLFPFFFFFNDTATTEIYTLSLHDALPIYVRQKCGVAYATSLLRSSPPRKRFRGGERSEEHTSELQSHLNLVCRLLLEKKKNIMYNIQRSNLHQSDNF